MPGAVISPCIIRLCSPASSGCALMNCWLPVDFGGILIPAHPDSDWQHAWCDAADPLMWALMGKQLVSRFLHSRNRSPRSLQKCDGCMAQTGISRSSVIRSECEMELFFLNVTQPFKHTCVGFADFPPNWLLNVIFPRGGMVGVAAGSDIAHRSFYLEMGLSPAGFLWLRHRFK